MQAGDRLLLCSDGLWGTVSDSEITDQLSALPLSDSVPELVEQALRNGGPKCDNVSVLAMEWEGIENDSTMGIQTTSLGEAVFASTIQASVLGTDVVAGRARRRRDRALDQGNQRSDKALVAAQEGLNALLALLDALSRFASPEGEAADRAAPSPLRSPPSEREGRAPLAPLFERRQSGMTFKRSLGRAHDALRPVSIVRGFTRHAEGSVLVSFGDTRVLCTASVEEKVPPHKRGSGEGWLTAEYGMLPRSTHTRSDREAARGKQSGRTQEIQRLIGRSLRCVFDLSALGERTISLDCDVLQADGGTRTAAITGAFVAAHDAVSWLVAQGKLARSPIRDFVAAVSVGIVDGTPLLDLEYVEDAACDTDMNVVMTATGGFVELQGTAEGATFSRAEMDALLALAGKGIGELVAAQRRALAAPLPVAA